MANGTRTANYESAVQSWRDDSQFSVDYSKGYLGLEHAYARGLTGRGLTIGVNDSGVHSNHPLFSGAGKLRGIDTGVGDLYGNNGEVNPRLYWASHGTHVAGSTAGNRMNNGRMFGNAFNANIVSANTNFSAGDYRWAFDRLNGEPVESAVANLLRMAQDGQIRIVNNSWGGGPSPVSNALRTAILDNDVLMVFAAGNDEGARTTGYGLGGSNVPALRGNWLTVANYQGNDEISPTSSICGRSATYCVSGPGHEIGRAHV